MILWGRRGCCSVFWMGGADINLKAPKWNVPIQTIIDEMIAPDAEVAPLYDVLFSYPGIAGM